MWIGDNQGSPETVAEITPLEVTTDQIGKGVRSGWGGITRMEVSGGGKKDWDGVKVKENLSSGSNDFSCRVRLNRPFRFVSPKTCASFSRGHPMMVAVG